MSSWHAHGHGDKRAHTAAGQRPRGGRGQRRGRGRGCAGGVRGEVGREEQPGRERRLRPAQRLSACTEFEPYDLLGDSADNTTTAVPTLPRPSQDLRLAPRRPAPPSEAQPLEHDSADHSTDEHVNVGAAVSDGPPSRDGVGSVSVDLAWGSLHENKWQQLIQRKSGDWTSSGQSDYGGFFFKC